MKRMYFLILLTTSFVDAMEPTPTQKLFALLGKNKVADEKAAVQQIQELINAGANIQAEDEADNNFLHRAAYHNYSLIIDYLLEKKVGPSLMACNRQILTPLHIAAQYGNIKVIHRLIAANAPLATFFDSQPSPLQMALPRHINAAAILMNAGAEIDIHTPITPAIASELFLAGAPYKPYLIKVAFDSQINERTNDTHATPLMHAAAQRNYVIVKDILDRGAWLFVQDLQKRTVFDILQNIFSMEWELAPISSYGNKPHKIYQKIATKCGKKALHFLMMLKQRIESQRKIIIARDVWLSMALLILGKDTFALSKQAPKSH